MANPYLYQTLTQKNPDLSLPMREAEVECLRRALFNAKAETFELHQRVKNLESHLYRLAELVLAGEWQEAQEIAALSLELCKTEKEKEG